MLVLVLFRQPVYALRTLRTDTVNEHMQRTQNHPYGAGV